MVDVEFIVQYLVLQYSSKFPQLVNNFGNIKMLEMASDADLIPKDLAFEVSAIYRKYRRIQHEFRLNSPSVPGPRSQKRRVCGRGTKGSRALVARFWSVRRSGGLKAT